MAFEGTLATLSFADLLQLLGSTRKTGTLHLTRGSQFKRVYLRDGIVLAVSSNDPGEYVSHTLVSVGKISEDVLRAALHRQESEGKLLGQILVEQGDISEEGLKQYLLDRAYEMVAKLMGWNDALFRFEEFVLPEKQMVSLDLSVEGLLMEGFRRIDEWHLIEREVDNFDTVFLRNEDALAQVGKAKLTREELAVLELVNGKHTVKEIIRQSKMGSFDVTKMLFRLLSIKLVRRRVLPVAV